MVAAQLYSKQGTTTANKVSSPTEKGASELSKAYWELKGKEDRRPPDISWSISAMQDHIMRLATVQFGL